MVSDLCPLHWVYSLFDLGIHLSYLSWSHVGRGRGLGGSCIFAQSYSAMLVRVMKFNIEHCKAGMGCFAEKEFERFWEANQDMI